MHSSARGADLRLVSAFLEMLSAERGAAANTLAAYARDLDLYAGFLTRRVAVDLDAASSDDIRDWLEDHAGGGIVAVDHVAAVVCRAAIAQVCLCRRHQF
jgi:site-specific recombinase XerD